MGFDFFSLDPFNWTGKQSELSLFPKDQKLEDLRSTDQKTTQQILMELATGGSGAGITLGTPYSGSLGSFSPTSQEQTGLSQLFNQPTSNTALNQAQDVFSKMSQASFDPSVLDPFMKAAQRSAQEGSDILDRDAAVTGTRFGTAILGEKANLSENIQNNIQQKLAELFLSQQGVSMQGAQGLAGVGGQQAGMAQQNLANMFNYGALERQLKNQEAQAQYNEFARQRDETLGRVNLLSQEANRNPYMGVSSIPGYSVLTELMKPAMQGAMSGLMGGL